MNLRQRTAYRTTTARIQIPLFETEHETPWDIVEAFLAESARFVRLIVTRGRGHASQFGPPEAPFDVINAFDFFGDAIASELFFDAKIIDRARRELRRIDDIRAQEFISSKERARDLYHLIKDTREPMSDEPPSWS